MSVSAIIIPDASIQHLSTLLKQRNEKNQFAYYLGSDKGAITFGGADMRFKKDFNEEFQWAPITEKNYWTIELMDIRKYKSNAVYRYNHLY